MMFGVHTHSIHVNASVCCSTPSVRPRQSACPSWFRKPSQISPLARLTVRGRTATRVSELTGRNGRSSSPALKTELPQDNRQQQQYASPPAALKDFIQSAPGGIRRVLDAVDPRVRCVYYCAGALWLECLCCCCECYAWHAGTDGLPGPDTALLCLQWSGAVERDGARYGFQLGRTEGE